MVNNNGGGHLLDTGQPLEVLRVLSCVEHFPCLILLYLPTALWDGHSYHLAESSQ